MKLLDFVVIFSVLAIFAFLPVPIYVPLWAAVLGALIIERAWWMRERIGPRPPP